MSRIILARAAVEPRGRNPDPFLPRFSRNKLAAIHQVKESTDTAISR
ncbi:MAG: hypothetical protein HY210_06355 [Candidatus Omnitrophica bacterium]|nr:hypothetical protein [Candidatus Omnitrophota bacterium]